MRVKLIAGFDGFYKVSDTGLIWSCYPKGRLTRERPVIKGDWVLRRQTQHKAGHMMVSLSFAGKRGSYYVHRLILEAFVGPCPEGMECRHLNGIPNDNRLENLEWSTYQINQMDRAKHGTSNRGERCASSRLTKDQVIKIRKKYAAGKITYRELAEIYEVSQSTVYELITRQTWKHIV